MLFGIILIRIIAELLSKDYFGIFMIIKRLIAVGVTLITLNLELGLARYVSLEKEKSKLYLNFSLWTVSILSFIVIIISTIFSKNLSKFFYNSTEYGILIICTGFTIFSFGIFSIFYAFFRGRQEMIKANKMQIFFHLFPIFLFLLFWNIFSSSELYILSNYLVSISLSSLLLGFFYVKNYTSFTFLKKYLFKLNLFKDLFIYSIMRIPSGFLLSLVFSAPVFFASKTISLETAAYLGIIVSVVRLMEIFVTPFNLLLLPKFAELKRATDKENLKEKINIIMNFIITALPLLVALLFGLSKYIVIIFFGQKYILTQQSISIVIIFSYFYLSYALIRGILDGLFKFPYVNIICAFGILVTSFSLLFFNKSILLITTSFGMGLLAMGLLAMYILVKKVNLDIKIKEVSFSLILSSLSLFVLYFIDNNIELAIQSELIEFVLKVLSRAALLFIIFIFYWRPKKWFKALYLRISTK